MPKRMLVVDDDRAIAQLAVFWLKAEGFDAEVTYDGHSALRAARARRPDAILLDMRMPCLDGLGVLAQLRREPALTQVPVVILSANAQEIARRQALEAGAQAYLTKPYESRELIDAVHRAIGRAA